MDENRRPTFEAVDTPGTTPLATRRAVLAAGGAVALGSLAGCTALDGLVDRASDEALGTTEASPAAFYAGSTTLPAGDDAGGAFTSFRSDPADVRYVPPTIQAASRAIEIDGWSTSTATKAQDYNSSRSNKPRTIWWPGPDDDDDDDDTGTLVSVLDTERALLIYADAAIEAVDSQSNDDAKASLDAFIDGTTEVRERLEGCPSETCRTVFENADVRKGLAQDASDAVDAGDWDSARKSLQQTRRIVQGDIDRIHDDLDSDGDGLGDGTESLYAYLGGEPTIGERFVVSLPDTRVRGDGPALGDELTPQRVLEYFIGDHNAKGCAESDHTVAVHRALSCRDLLSATLTEGRGTDKSDRMRCVVAFQTSGGVVVTGSSPDVDGAAPALFVSDDGAVTAPAKLDSWGDERSAGEATVSQTLVRSVAAQPADCPSPMPALLYLRRIHHNDQILYAGGWLIDDGALYEDTATLLVGDGPNIVAGVSRSDIEEGGIDLQSRATVRKKPGRTKYGNITLSAPYDPDADYLPAGAQPVCRDDGNVSYWGVQSREALAKETGTGDCDDGNPNEPPSCIVTALDAPVLHLVGAAEVSNDVKFKAGAELSKAVN
ncbi:hypothetical protein [Haloarchaeobius sp. DYHT-AS-18]|uniref:hypothetical protein n=1 Tax=Haloarchaeobius sp. DYHT-AS-18 TaxID=3446117 RepID=UPI003EC0EC67